MTSENLIFHAIDRITVTYEQDYKAVYTRYFRAYDEFGVFLPAAVRAGLDYATKRQVANWVVDVSQEKDSMSEKDAEWEASEEFRQLFRASSIRRILLRVGPPEQDSDLDGERAWAHDFAQELGDDFVGGVATSEEKIREFCAA